MSIDTQQDNAKQILENIKGLKRIDKMFQKKNRNILAVYYTAGYPKIGDTLEVMTALEEAGVDMIELGIPDSAPLADGAEIQQSNTIALANGMSIAKLFEQLQGFRKKVYVPVVLKCYLNPVLEYGFEKFCQHAAAEAIDGFIIPDMPIEEYENEYKNYVDKYGLSFIFMVTPENDEARIRKIDSVSSGFLYAVSSSANQNLEKQSTYFQKLESLNLHNPVLTDFGISDKNTFDLAVRHTNGAIIGSAYIKAITDTSDIAASTSIFIRQFVK